MNFPKICTWKEKYILQVFYFGIFLSFKTKVFKNKYLNELLIFLFNLTISTILTSQFLILQF